MPHGSPDANVLSVSETRVQCPYRVEEDRPRAPKYRRDLSAFGFVVRCCSVLTPATKVMYSASNVVKRATTRTSAPINASNPRLVDTCKRA